MFVALANRGALAPKNASVAAKNTIRAIVAGRIVTTNRQLQLIGRGKARRGPNATGLYHLCAGWIVPTLSLVAMTYGISRCDCWVKAVAGTPPVARTVAAAAARRPCW